MHRPQKNFLEWTNDLLKDERTGEGLELIMVEYYSSERKDANEVTWLEVYDGASKDLQIGCPITPDLDRVLKTLRDVLEERGVKVTNPQIRYKDPEKATLKR